MENPILDSASRLLETRPARSAWARGVRDYAADLLQGLDDTIAGKWEPADILESRKLTERAMLNGAHDWKQYSEGGNALCYDFQIARALCNPSELKRTRNGERRPNARETWLDVQARALWQAARLVLEVIDEARNN